MRWSRSWLKLLLRQSLWAEWFFACFGAIFRHHLGLWPNKNGRKQLLKQ
jgi:hypothetical protein